jgi:DNA helicase-2/ATP-dependent DNA helicase PcrA
VSALADLIKQFAGRAEKAKFAEMARDLLARIDYEGELGRLYSDPNERQARWDAVQEVVNSLAAYEQKAKKPKLLEFLDEVTLGDREFDNEKDKQLQKNAVVLMTLHSAKGLEYPHVYMVGMEEGILPHHRSLADNEAGVDEERRLCYVGVTRAQDRLTLSFPRTRMKWGKPRDTIPSRFLYELTGQADNPLAIQQRQRAFQQASDQRRQGAARRAASRAGKQASRGKGRSSGGRDA